MTVDRFVTFSLSDIQAVCFQCEDAECGARLIVPPDNLDIGVLDECPSCRRDWWRKAEGAKGMGLPTGATPMVAFLKALPRIRLAEDNGLLGFTLLLQFDDPSCK